MGVSPSAVSRVCGTEVSWKNFNVGNAAMLPQGLAIIGQGNDSADYSLDKIEISDSASAAKKFGYGSPLHLAAKQLFPLTGASAEFRVTLYPLRKASTASAAAASIAAEGAVTANGSGTVYIGGIAIDFGAVKDDTAADVLGKIKEAINASLDVPAIAGGIAESALSLTSKWSGKSGNMISLWIEADIPGIVFTPSGFRFTGGTIDPDITPGLSKIGPVWETFILDCFDYKENSHLDMYQDFGEGRWSVLEKKPLLVCHGCTDDLEIRTAITDSRRMDKINFLIVSVGSRELPFVVGAKGLINDVMTTANKNPAQGYKGLLTGLHRGDDSVQENYTQRTASVNKGSSTCIPNGSVAELNDIITFWHPESEGSFPSFRYVCDIVKLQNIVFNVKLIMEADAMKGAPLVTDDTVTINPAAVAPKTIKTAFYNLADSLALNAILVKPDFTKKIMAVKIDGANPKRVNVTFPVKISGNVEISSTDVYFGFYLGGE
jgi:phage tail sheath gpL-like